MMKRETYLEKIKESEAIVNTLRQVCTVIEASSKTSCNTYRAAMDELQREQAYIERTKKKIGVK